VDATRRIMAEPGEKTPALAINDKVTLTILVSSSMGGNSRVTRQGAPHGGLPPDEAHALTNVTQ